MKKSFKIKIKYLILIPIFILIIFPNLLYIAAKGLFNNKGFIGDSLARDYSYGILKLYDKWPKLPSFDGDANYMMGKSVYYNFSNNGSVSKDSSTPKNTIGWENSNAVVNRTREDYEMAISYHEKGLDSSYKDLSAANNIVALCNLYLDGGHIDKAKAMIDKGLISQDEDVVLACQISNISFLIRTGEIKDAIIESEKLHEEFKFKITENIYIDTLYSVGEIDKAIELQKNQGFSNPHDTKLSSKTEKNIISVYNQLDTVKNRNVYYDMGKEVEASHLGTSTIEGNLTYGSNPIPYQLVTLGYNDGAEHTFNTEYITYTDKDGKYVFTNLPEGKYYLSASVPNYLFDKYSVGGVKNNNDNLFQIDINMDNSIITNNIKLIEKPKIQNEDGDNLSGDGYKIKWDSVEAVSSYSLDVYVSGGYYEEFNEPYSFCLEYKGITDTEFTLPLVDGSIMSLPICDPNLKDYKNQGVNYLGSVDGREIRVKIVALDQNNQNIFNETGVWSFYEFTILKPEKKKLNDGDKLMEKGKIQEGIKWYNTNIEKYGYEKEYIYPLLKNLCLKETVDEAEKEEFEKLLDELYKINNNEPEIKLYREIFDDGRHRKLGEY